MNDTGSTLNTDKQEINTQRDKLYQCKSTDEIVACLRDFLMQKCTHDAASTTDERNAKIITYISSHYTSPDLNLNVLADQFHLSPSYCSQLVRHSVGRSVPDYLLYLRVELAKKLLAETDHIMKDIASMSGFGTPLNMIRGFKKLEGITPSAYRNSIKA